jgi:hypothetical protein
VALSTKNQSMKSIKFLKMSSLLGLLINQSINHIYLLIILKTSFVTAIHVATLRIRNGVTDSKIVSTFVYILYTHSTLPPCFTCTVSVYIVTIRSFSRDGMVVGFTTTYAIGAYHH